MKGEKAKKELTEENAELINKGNIAKRYIKLKKVCNIHFGEIFKVKSKITGDIFACKQILKSKIADQDKFFHDVVNCLKINHPNLPKTIEVYDSPRFVYIIQELIEGENLFDKIIRQISNGENYSEKDALTYYRQIMSALQCLHSNYICHKDIKPGNIKIVDNQDPNIPNKQIIKLIDGGTSKIFGELKSTVTTTTGKKGESSKEYNPVIKNYEAIYTPLELLQGNYEEKSDVWVATIILFQMLTGIIPFKGEDSNEILKQISKKRLALKGIGITDEAKEFFKKVFVDYGQRLSSQQVLDYEYIKNYENASNDNLAKFELENFKTFSKSHSLKKNMVDLIIGGLSQEDVIKIREKFENIKGEDGCITINQLKETFMEGMDETKENKKKLKLYFEQLDLNGDGKVDFNEFLRIALEQLNFFDEEMFINIFKMMDADSNGYLTKDEIIGAKEIGVIKEEPCNALLKFIETNPDGRITYEDFLNLLGSAGIKKEEEGEEEKKESK